MASTLAEIRAKLQAQEDKKGGNNSNFKSSDTSLYPFWNIAEGETAVVRFLPDADTTNSYFWIERAMIKLSFSGIKGQNDSKPCVIQVPCMETWNETCPILAEVRPWFKDPKLEEMGRKYWKKRSYFFQGLVHKNPLSDDVTPENPIRKLIISPQVFNLVKAALMDPELEELPVDFSRGLDFSITKGTKGGYSDYSTSKWSRKESALTDVERDAIATHGLFDLKNWLPKKPGAVELKAMTEMFEASVDGQAYDLERWGQYFKPFGIGRDDPAADSSSAAAPAESAPKAAEVSTPAPVAAAPTSAGGSKAEDIIAMIRNRQNKAA